MQITSASASFDLPMLFTKKSDSEIFLSLSGVHGYINILKIDSSLSVIWNLKYYNTIGKVNAMKYYSASSLVFAAGYITDSSTYIN